MGQIIIKKRIYVVLRLWIVPGMADPCTQALRCALGGSPYVCLLRKLHFYLNWHFKAEQ